MINNLNAMGTKEEVSISRLLFRLGFEPTINSGQDTFYHNVFDAANPGTKNSLRINNELDAWFDKDLGIGGNIVDFGLAYWRSLDRLEVINRISELFKMTIPQDAARSHTA
ncbi:MAG: hypothetical protein EOO20_00310 [Chryseobacterium sp.]|nr:MAG: hypothetical protein EOO20_00310 [Chryseobacterium sp.]